MLCSCNFTCNLFRSEHNKANITTWRYGTRTFFETQFFPWKEVGCKYIIRHVESGCKTKKVLVLYKIIKHPTEKQTRKSCHNIVMLENFIVYKSFAGCFLWNRFFWEPFIILRNPFFLSTLVRRILGQFTDGIGVHK